MTNCIIRNRDATKQMAEWCVRIPYLGNQWYLLLKFLAFSLLDYGQENPSETKSASPIISCQKLNFPLWILKI